MITSSALMLAVLGYLGVMLKSIPMKLISFIFNRHSFTITVSISDFTTYRGLCRYIENLNHPVLQNNVKMEYSNDSSDESWYYNGLNYGTYLIMLDKFTVAEISRKIMTSTDSRNNVGKDVMSIRVFGLNRDKHRDKIFESTLPDNDRGIRTVYNTGKSLSSTTYVPRRDIDDIFSPIKDKILNHVDLWSKNKDFYKKNGLIHKTGILLYGPPGTGKSTMVRALANHLGYGICIMDISSDTTSKDLTDMVMDIPFKSIVLIEDIDCIPCMDDEADDIISNGIRTKNDKSVFRTFLQVMDGINSPNDVIFICTTNHIEKLDYRLLRKGRIDLQLEMTDLDEDYAKSMCDKYNASYDILKDEKFPINPSKLQHMIFENIGIYG